MNNMIDEELINRIYDYNDDDIEAPEVRIIIDINDTIQMMRTKALQYIREKYLKLEKDHNEGTISNDKFVNELIRTNNQYLEVEKVIQFKSENKRVKKRTKWVLD